MSEVKVNKISPRTACGTTTLGDSGDTFNIPCGSKINVASGGNITVASGATITNNGTQTGFGRTGTVDWQTGDIKTGDFTGATGKGYFVNTTSGTITATLPASPTAGDIVGLKDYALTWDTNSCFIGRNSEPINGGTGTTLEISTEGATIMLVYVDGVKGWIPTQDDASALIPVSPTYIVATGGTPSQFGDYEIRTFTGPGTFTVCSVGNPVGSDAVDYVVTGGGGGGGTGTSGGSGGGGAGGYRAFTCQPVTATGYPVVVGGGGPGKGPGVAPQVPGTVGNLSTFRCNSSAGGGYGGSQVGGGCGNAGGAGGSGGGGAWNAGAAGAGNTPPTPVSQGNPGGAEGGACNGGAGGGAGGAGPAGQPGTTISPGGAGADISPLYGPGVGASGLVAGGGGAGGYCAAGGVGGPGGGGAGAGGPTSPTIATNGTAYTGGGGGGATSRSGPPAGPTIQAGNGGDGAVIIRYKFQ